MRRMYPPRMGAIHQDLDASNQPKIWIERITSNDARITKASTWVRVTARHLGIPFGEVVRSNEICKMFRELGHPPTLRSAVRPEEVHQPFPAKTPIRELLGNLAELPLVLTEAVVAHRQPWRGTLEAAHRQPWQGTLEAAHIHIHWKGHTVTGRRWRWWRWGPGHRRRLGVRRRPSQGPPCVQADCKCFIGARASAMAPTIWVHQAHGAADIFLRPRW